jgi:hypothetical protein
MTSKMAKDISADLDEILNKYGAYLNGIKPGFRVKERPDGPYLIIEFAKPTPRLYKIHNEVMASLDNSNYFKERSTIQRREGSPKTRLQLPETQLLRNEIAQNLTIDQHSFDDDFFVRYTPSVSGLEQQITAKANFVVYGRRGAGKSSLLAYAMRSTRRAGAKFAWISMQTYANRQDVGVVPAIVAALLYELSEGSGAGIEIDSAFSSFETLSEQDNTPDILVQCDKLVPKVRRILGKMASSDRPLTIFLDDLHVVSPELQPVILGFVYKMTRGNNSFIKISGISQLTNLWDGGNQTGLQAPHDAQILNLDHNLTIPDKSKEHIIGILSSHAQFCGLPDVGYLSGDRVLSRLVLVAAGVPRDSLNIFSLAITKAIAKNQKLVSVISINAAASEMAEEKLKDIEKDSGGDLKDIRNLLDEVKDFCISQKRVNAFLVEIQNAEPRYQLMQKLVALRLVHLLHEGITPHQAGRRYIALMLDYGFYVGVRAAKSVKLIPDEPRVLSAKELRSLPIFK